MFTYLKKMTFFSLKFLIPTKMLICGHFQQKKKVREKG